MTPERRLLQHELAALAYRAQKALRGAPASFASFSAGPQVRTPAEIVRHMTSVLGYARTFFVGGSFPRHLDPLPTFAAEIGRFHETLEALSRELEAGTPLREIAEAQLLQGPLADVMTHVGQLALLRRLAGHPVPPENFIFADVRAERLGPDQPPPARPDAEWPERPA
jgi:hypothetical protein